MRILLGRRVMDFESYGWLMSQPVANERLLPALLGEAQGLGAFVGFVFGEAADDALLG